MTGGLELGALVAAGAAWTRSAAGAERERDAEPGSSGWSGGKFGSIGGRAVATRGAAGSACMGFGEATGGAVSGFGAGSDRAAAAGRGASGIFCAATAGGAAGVLFALS